MSLFLGIDTSNYTTSVALYDTTEKKVIHSRKLLPVKEGERGIRQSDAVFHHTQQLRELLPKLLADGAAVSAVAVSVSPRRAEGSYMPCFTVGHTVAASVAAALSVPLYEVSHQEGHIAAALFGADRTDLFGEDFFAFHVSGGTTESLRVRREGDNPVSAKLIGSSNDLKAGQAIDRVGLMLGLRFPCGPELERLAGESAKTKKDFPGLKVSMNGADCSLSGIENKCRDMQSRGEPACDIAMFCLCSIEKAIEGMLKALPDEKLPVVFSGGVMSDIILQEQLRHFCLSTGREAVFTKPEFSSDNAAGVAILASLYGENND